MPIQQIAYDIPTDLAVGIMKGVYKRFGGVVRDAKTGAIVKHLKEIELPEKKSDGAVAQAIKQHPVVAVGVGAAAIVGTAGTAYIVNKKKEKLAKANAPECVWKFEKSLKKYLKAVRKGNLDEKTIDVLMKNLESIRESEDGAQISLDLSTKELKQLVNMIYDYTKKLAKANDVKFDRFKKSSPNSIDDLQCYLEKQKEIFRVVA